MDQISIREGFILTRKDEEKAGLPQLVMVSKSVIKIYITSVFQCFTCQGIFKGCFRIKERKKKHEI